MMIKLINWLTKMIIQTMLVAGLTVYLTWVTVHTYVDKLLTQYHLNTVESKINFSDFLTQMSVSLNILKPAHLKNQAADEASKQAQDIAPTDDPALQVLADPVVTEIPAMANVEQTTSPKPVVSPSPTPSKAASANTEAAANDSVPVWNQTSSENKQEASKTKKQKELVMSAEDFTKKKDQIKEADKVTIFTLLATRLPQTEFQKISAYVEDGVTKQEWVDIQKIVEQYLKPDEYKELEGLLAKY